MGPVKRNPSPSQLDPVQAEALRKRLGRARKVKLYLLQQSGSNSFLVAGEQPDQKYKVNVGPQVGVNSQPSKRIYLKTF